MAQYITETIFDLVYLITVVSIGFKMFTGNSGNPLVKKYGMMAMVLGGGDSFHLIPRVYAMWGLTFARVALCLLPQNDWLNYRQPLLYGVLRNIPFAIIGILMIMLFAQEAKKANDSVFRFMPLAVALSFGFYVPVVLFSGILPIVGTLMIPKTMAYVWIVWMGYRLSKQVS